MESATLGVDLVISGVPCDFNEREETDPGTGYFSFIKGGVVYFRIKARLKTSKRLKMTSKDIGRLPETFFFQEHGHVAYQLKIGHHGNSLKMRM